MNGAAAEFIPTGIPRAAGRLVLDGLVLAADHAEDIQCAVDGVGPHLAGWNVRKMPLQVPQEPVIGDTGVTTPPPLAVPDFYATVRSCDLLDAITDDRRPLRDRP